MAKAFAQKFYKSKQWHTAREQALRDANYLCHRCGRPAEEVHHIIRLTPENIVYADIALNPANLECLCSDCHYKEHNRERHIVHTSIKEMDMSQYYFDENGDLKRIQPPTKA